MNEYLQYKKSLVKFNPENYGLATIDLNPTELCNRVCHFCPRSSFYPSLNLNMSLESADLLQRRLVEFNYQGALTIAGKGEPLLNKNIYGIITFLNFWNPILITNGDSILKDNSIAKKLFDSGVHQVIISEYDSMTKTEIWDELFEGRNYRVKDLTKGAEPYFNNRGGSFNTINNSLERTCYFPFYKITINHDLSLNFCLNDWKYKEEIGNLTKNTLKDVWMGSKMMAYRKKLIEKRRCDINACKKCDTDGTLMGQESFEWFQTL